ncbi:MAG: endonuclease/exonuclease/phosphatase family protein [Chloroflexi bacterium]|nr:endonuclease/exonuclease/phosphatase family protein [Chloroflexota bacterium]
MTGSRLRTRDVLTALALPALTTVFGLQMLRVLLPSFVWYLGDTVGLSYLMLGPIAIGTFLAAFLAAAFRRLLGPRLALLIVVGGIGLARLVEQFSASPALDLALAMLGMILFTLFLPIYLAHTRAQGGDATRQFGLGFLLGFALDTTVHGAFGTLDLSWQHGFVAPILVAFAVGVQWWLLARTPRVEAKATDSGLRRNLPLAALGPFIFLSVVILQNVARATALTGWAQPVALGWILLANAVGLARTRWTLKPWSAGVGTALLIALVWLSESSSAAAAAMYFIGNVAAFPLVAAIFAGLGAEAEHGGLWRATVANGFGWLLFVLFTFIYYISYNISLGIPNAILPPLSAALIGLAALAAVYVSPREPAPSADWTPAALATAMLIVPLLMPLGWREPMPTTGKGFPVRVMTYNIHNGFNTDGRLDLEAIAQVIEQAQPDIVGLEEVARGWAIDSSVDILTWLSQRLQMPYIYGPTADPVWGNAILSRYPIVEWGNVPLPPRTLALKRGFLWARMDVGGGEELLFIATHWHDVEEDTEIRQQQAPELVRFWARRPSTVLLGDLNATPDAKEIAILRDAGLRDAFAEIGAGTGLTWPAHKPEVRIDYIWFSPDLKVSDLVIPRSTASDHLGITVKVGK